MRVDGKFLAVDGFPFFDGNSLTVDGNSNFDGKSPLYRDRPPVRYFYVGKITQHRPGNYEWTAMPMGLASSPGWFQSIMLRVCDLSLIHI